MASYIGNFVMATNLYADYPHNCAPVVDGKQRCTMTVPYYDEHSKSIKDYTYLWSDSNINKAGNPSYYFGGLSWFQVDKFATFFLL